MRLVLGSTLMLVLACGAPHAATSGADSAVPAAPTAPAAPAPTTLEGRLDALVAKRLADTPLLDLQVAVVKDGKPLLLRAYGPADLEGHVPLTLDSIMEIGSVTKQLTAVAALQLVDAGKLHLSDAVATYVPGIAAKITIADLLHQTSGLVGFGTPANLGKSPEQITAAIVAAKPGFAPGARWEYSNSNYWVLGRIVEKVSGQSYGAYLQDHLLAPAGMASTHVCGPDDHVVGSVAKDGKVVAGQAVPVASYGGAGALCSTVGDLLRWQDALSGAKLLSPASLAFMTTPAKLADGSATTYGAGVMVDKFLGQRRIWHNGAIPYSAQAELDFYPEAHLQVVLLTRTISDPPGAVMRKLADALAGQVLLTDRPVDAAYAARVVGAYANDRATVRVRLTDDDGLHALLPRNEDSKLVHVEANDFVLAVNPRTTYRFVFAQGAAEGAPAASIDVLSDGAVQAKVTRVAKP